MSHTVSTQLVMPPHLHHAVLSGEAVLKGGVIRHAHTGKIMALLREAGSVPASPASLAQGLPGGVAKALGLTAQTASFLNLGATVAFGAATLYKLNKIDKKLDALGQQLTMVEGKIDELNAKVDRLGWNVEMGFASTLRSLSILERSIDNEINAQLTAAAQAAWSAQFLAPDSAQRMMRLEQARATASVATERILAQTMQGFTTAEMLIDNTSAGSKPFLLLSPDSVLEFLSNMRKSAVAVSLNSNIMAECGDTYAAATIIKDQTARLKSSLVTIGRQYLGNGGLHLYAYLLKSVLADLMPMDRLAIWVERFDPRWEDLNSVISQLRKENLLSSELPEEEEGFWGDSSVGIGVRRFCEQFFDLMDACWEDLNRLEGFALELSIASKYMDSWQEYRDVFTLADAPEDSPLVFMIPNTELILI